MRVIFRRCPVCHEEFVTPDRKQLYCSDYCKNLSGQSNQPSKPKNRRVRPDRKTYSAQ